MKKTIQHYRTSALEYVNINLSNIPSSQKVTSLDAVPNSKEIYHMVNPPKYIVIPSTGLYYELKGKRPDPDMLSYGEISICFKTNHESILFKNSDNDIVEIPVNNNTYYNNTTLICGFYNPIINYNGTNTYIWSIPFEDIQLYNIDINLCTFSMRNILTGSQVVAEFTINNETQTVDIPIIYKPTDTTIENPELPANTYMVICTGALYNN